MKRFRCDERLELDIKLCGGKVPYTVLNPIPEGDVLACEIQQRKVRGYGSFFRLSLVNTEDGPFTRVESSKDEGGGCGGVNTRFHTLSPDEHDRGIISKMSLSFWKKHMGGSK